MDEITSISDNINIYIEIVLLYALYLYIKSSCALEDGRWRFHTAAYQAYQDLMAFYLQVIIVETISTMALATTQMKQKKRWKCFLTTQEFLPILFYTEFDYST